MRFVFLHDTKVSDISPLVELKNLYTLNLSNTQVTDLSPLAELKKLEWLIFEDTNVTEEQVEKLRMALPNCMIFLID